MLFRSIGGSEMSIVGYDGSSSASTSGTISGLVGGREYSFVVSALNRGGEGDMSAVFAQSTSPIIPTFKPDRTNMELNGQGKICPHSRS